MTTDALVDWRKTMQQHRSIRGTLLAALGVSTLWFATLSVPTTAAGNTARNHATLESQLAFEHPALATTPNWTSGAGSEHRSALSALGLDPRHAILDRTTGRWATLMPSEPLLPGRANSKTWSEIGLSEGLSQRAIEEAAARQLLRYIERHADPLRISPDQIARPVRASVIGDKVLLYAGRIVNGVPVHRSHLTATISQGNLVLLGAARWGDVDVPTVPSTHSPERTFDRYLTRSFRDLEHGLEHSLEPGLEQNAPLRSWGETNLILLPFQENERLSYRLAYTVKRTRDGHPERWDGWVDAHSGELLAVQDRNHYARHVVGGVYPLTNDGIGEEGQQQPRWPMPYADLNGGIRFAGRDGALPGAFAGEVTTSLSGRYVTVTDECGVIDESSVGLNADLDLGVSDSTNCTPPPGGSPGNTVAARTAYYETNRIAEWARSRLPDNTWLASALPVSTNIPFTCGGFWNGTSLQLYQSGFPCANTGEIATIIDHEWGHGLDDNDNNGIISYPGEGIADVYAALRQNESCVGRGFIETGALCSGYGDPCTECPGGIRDIDWEKRQSGAPHDVAWVDANCGGCAQGTRQCVGTVTAESIWDLAKRDLPARSGADENQALEITTRLTLLGAQNVGDWFSCRADGEDGCGAESGYMNFLAIDDDDGDLTNGTPHMPAIAAAFGRHGIACSTLDVQEAGCEGRPNEAPIVTSGALPGRIGLRWDPVPDAERYVIYRTEGMRACSRGKLFLGSTGGTTWIDNDVLSDFDYHYTVAAIGDGRSCLGPMSDCVTVAAPELSFDDRGPTR